MTHVYRARFVTDFAVSAVLIAAYLLIGWFFWRPVSTLAKPDEALHLVYLYDLRQGVVWPRMTSQPEPPFTGNQQRCQPPLYYWLAALISAPTPMNAPAEWIADNPLFLVGIPDANGARFIGTPDQMAVVYVLRLWSWLMGALVVCAVYGAARAWLPRPVSALAAWMCAALPSALFIQTGPGGITLAAPLNALVLMQMMWAWRGGLTGARAARLSALLALAIWTRVELIFLLLPLALLLLREWKLGRRRVKPWLVIGLGLLSTAPLFIRNLALYADPLASACLFRRDAPLALADWWAREGGGFARASLVSLGEGFVFAPEWLYAVLVGALALGALGWISQALRRQPIPSAAGLLAAHAVTLAMVTLNGSLNYIAGGPRYLAVYGVAWITLWAAGWTYLWPRRWRRFGAALGLASWLALDVFVILSVLIPQYVPHKTGVEQTNPIVARFWGDGQGVVLRSVRVDPDQPRPGDVVTVRLVWEVVEPVRGNPAVFVHAAPDEFSLPLAQRVGYPVNGNYPFAWWKPGDVFEDTIRLELPSAPATYKLTAGLFNPSTNARTPAFNGAEQRFANDTLVLRDVKSPGFQPR